MDVTSSSADCVSAARDIDRAITSDWPSHRFPLTGPRDPSTRVVIRQSVLNEIHRHGQSRTDVEVCGVWSVTAIKTRTARSCTSKPAFAASTRAINWLR